MSEKTPPNTPTGDSPSLTLVSFIITETGRKAVCLLFVPASFSSFYSISFLLPFYSTLPPPSLLFLLHSVQSRALVSLARVVPPRLFSLRRRPRRRRRRWLKTKMALSWLLYVTPFFFCPASHSRHVLAIEWGEEEAQTGPGRTPEHTDSKLISAFAQFSGKWVSYTHTVVAYSQSSSKHEEVGKIGGKYEAGN